MYPFSALVVCYNESRRLPQCLESLRFCDERMVIDLGSSDNSVEIARQMGAEVRSHVRVPIAEAVRMEAATWLRNDWVILLDPDEVFPTQIAERLWALTSADPALGCVGIPWRTYFRGKPLCGTRMGRLQSKHIVVHRQRVRLVETVNRGMEVCDGFTTHTLPAGDADAIRHYWVDSYSQYFEKHWRYIMAEAKLAYQNGARFWWQRPLRDAGRALCKDLFDYDGLRGGYPAWFVSLGDAWYYGMIQLALLLFQLAAQGKTR